MISIDNKFLGISLARRRTRRWVVVLYWCLVAFFAYAFFFHNVRHGLDLFGLLIAVQMLINLPGMLGGVRAGGAVKPYRGIHFVPLMERDGFQSLFHRPGASSDRFDPLNASLDEREVRQLQGVHFVSYTLIRWFALLLFAVYGILSVAEPAWLLRVGPFFFFLLTFVLWSLPQTLILWNEPDLESGLEQPR